MIRIEFFSERDMEGMVETEFSIVRFRGNKAAADKVYEGLQPRMFFHSLDRVMNPDRVIFRSGGSGHC